MDLLSAAEVFLISVSSGLYSTVAGLFFHSHSDALSVTIYIISVKIFIAGNYYTILFTHASGLSDLQPFLLFWTNHGSTSTMTAEVILGLIFSASLKWAACVRLFIKMEIANSQHTSVMWLLFWHGLVRAIRCQVLWSPEARVCLQLSR